MGCDGGTIPRRDELVRVKKKPEQVDKNAENAAKWKHCAVSQQPLRSPIVSCELGKLYNKIAIIEHLLSKDTTKEVVQHIRNLADVKEIKLTVNNSYKKGADKGDKYVDVHASQFICPITGVEMSGSQKFCYSWKCGCVLSEKAIKEVKSETCHKCGMPVQDDDLITLNPVDEELTTLKAKMEERRLKAKLDKKRKKAQISETVTSDKKVKLDAPSTSKSNAEMNGKTAPSKSNAEMNGKTAPSTSKSNTEMNGKTGKSSDGVKKNGTAGKSVSVQKLILPKKSQPEYSIAKDPNASAAFKSLFTSHEKAKNQSKAHWVTHNPLYF